MTKRPIRFFHSLTFKLYIAAAICILSLLAVNFLLNTFAFSGYYRGQKQAELVNAFDELNTLSQDQNQLLQHLQQRTAETSALLLWSDFQLLYRDRSIPLAEDNSPFLSLSPLDIPLGTYTISDRPLRGQEGLEILTLYGKTQNGLNAVMQVSLSDTGETTAIANRFLVISSLVMLIITAAAVVLISRYFTRPISRLSTMAQNMANLNFNERYTAYGHDELAELGNSLNTVSETMETTFSELKTANARLLNDMERVEQQNEARRSFISNVSHELKTPIALIQSYAEGLQENVAESEEQRRFYCDVICDEADRLSQIINRMTMLMQLESGKEELQIEHFDISTLCNRLLTRNAPLFAQQGIALSPLDDQPAFVWGDPQLIENVLSNYLSNALHHTEAGGRIVVSWFVTDNGTMRICVFNSGSPIPGDDLPRIWESFYKVDKARTRAYGGTGIGLSIVAAIMRVHRMPYGVRNLEDGVEFYIELPTK